MKTIIVTIENQDTFKILKECGDIIISENAKVEFPVLTTSGYIYLRENAKAEFPVLTTSGNIDLRENAKVEFPALTTSGYIDLRENAKAEFPVLTTSGYIDIGENAKLNHYKTKDLNYKSVDNSMFVIVSTKDTKGIKIHTGYNIQKIENGKIIKQDCYVAEKDSFYAHGETAKKAIGDLQFKIVSEKLKNEPILEDTELTVSHYRAITGACELGCKNFMEQNNIPFKIEDGKLIEVNPIKAKDLLPILEKNNAYGLGRFKQLIKF